MRYVTQPGRDEFEHFTIGEWTIRPSLDRLEQEDRKITIEPGAMDVLVYLARHAREVVSTDRLIAELWGGRIVEDNTVYKRIAQLRQALADDAHKPRYIETIPKHGYRLIAPVGFAAARIAAHGAEIRSQRPWIYATAVLAGLILALVLDFALRQPGPDPRLSAGAAGELRSLAVLPFVDMSAAGDQAYLGEGIAERLIHSLSGIPGLRVAARTSAFTFRDGTADVRTIGDQLNVDAVVEGSVQREGDQLRVTVQLVEVEGGYHVWSKSFDRDFDDLLAIQNEIAMAITDAVAGYLSEAPASTVAKAGTYSIDAYDHYLLGRHHLYQRTESSINRAIGLFQQAIGIDPDFAQAHAGLALGYVFLRRFTRVGPEVVPLAEAAAKNALTIEPDLAEAHMAMGNFLDLNQDVPGAETAYRRAIELDPNLALAHFWLSIVLNQQERLAESAEALETALALDPLSPHINSQWARHLINQGRIDEAITFIEKALALQPGYWPAVAQLIDIHLRLEQYGSAIKAILEFSALTEDAGRKAAALLDVADIYFSVYGDLESTELWIDQASQAAPGSETNLRVHLYLAQDRYEDASSLVHAWAAENSDEPFTLALAALYEMVIGHGDHAGRLYRQVEAAPLMVDVRDNNLFVPHTVHWGYLPAVHYAHVLMRSGEPDRGRTLLRQAHSFLTEVEECRGCEAGRAYILGSIRTLQGDKTDALRHLGRAIDEGWHKHWFLVRDPNLNLLMEEPGFVALAEDLAIRIADRRERLAPLPQFADR